MASPGYWVHDLDPVAFRLPGGLVVRYYGLAYALAFLIGYLLLRHIHKRGRSPLTAEQQVVMMTALIFGVFIGGRVGYVVLYAPGVLLREPRVVYQVWRGGMSSHGVFLGVGVACWLACRSFGVSVLRVADMLCLLGPPGILLVRVANFINGEFWGRPATVPWAVVFPQSAPPGTPLEAIPPRHPAQLYEAALVGIVLLAFTQWRFWRTEAQQRPGRLCGEFLVLYALVRLFCRLFRDPAAAWTLGMSRSTFYNVLLASVGLAVVIASQCRASGRPR